MHAIDNFNTAGPGSQRSNILHLAPTGKYGMWHVIVPNCTAAKFQHERGGNQHQYILRNSYNMYGIHNT